MRIAYCNGTEWLNALALELEALGHTITDESPDAVIGMSISQMPRIWQMHHTYPDALLFNYSWDIYSWVWTTPRPGEYDYKRYVELLNESTEVWVPSVAEQKRHDKLSIPTTVIKSYSLYFPLERTNGGYVFNAMREIPDEEWGWARKACEELGIPYVESDRNRTFEEYKDVLSGARLLISPNKEASTGGLSLIEGYYNGIPALVNGGGGNGGNEYVPCTTFLGYDDLRNKLLESFPVLDVAKCRKWVEQNYSPRIMAEKVNTRLCEYKS
jgi:hypothetical protein